MIIITLFIEYKDIDQQYYSNDGKTLTKVTDPYPNLRISAKCEIIQEKCFYDLHSLEYFTFEENPNLTVIGCQSFYYCINLKIIDLSLCRKLKIISNNAFFNCNQVSEINLPHELHEIQDVAFYSCSNIQNIIIPASVELIGKYAFHSSSQLKDVIFEGDSKLTSLESGVFAFTSITSFHISEKITKISGFAFSDSQLTNLTINEKNKHLKLENNTVFSVNKSILYFICNKSDTYEIPDYITTLGNELFYYSKLKSITIPPAVTTIGNNCFSSTKITSISNIGDKAFSLCSNLLNITFLSSLEIGNNLFDDCPNLELVIFPNNPMIVNSHSFSSDTSPKLRMSFTDKTLFSQSSIQRNTNISIFYLTEPNLIIDTNCLVMNFDQTEIYEFWGYNFSNGITIHKNVNTILESAFENSEISYICLELDSQLAVIQKFAFRNCRQLCSFNSSLANLRTLGYSAFKDCINLKALSFGSPDLVVMNNAFENCINLESISSMTNIQDKCFS
ncbi:surface antigen BspA-like [Trichomonas vaginalis G3]|uniref:Surface antigen BspA-like n=1 Tax=Trichomonas vaginalis (strain ATCC PRA-98 / G3) TaxID=412133 RepID=A2ES91_TRIV3|nr:ribonuclease inhibitor domain-containing protein [Trichomonas vaginalis G3]EAY04455.1 surface antigen BspA-like [Trichomonas vaginalis G3]KAI5510287.1 ribonuclease inhibitor domain-containing protein [Trichomonas vaginalis G3]|eukprot:XP_001316678.1 surface antigen BspA-like [Trichomonas vaginalis G3]